MLQSLKEFNIVSVCVRLVPAALVGAIIGFGRSRQKQTAGMRTYLITCVGAALASITGFYEYAMLKGNVQPL
ncbi:MAG: MgtC/SapB family protein [Clostridia bacterium]|nr:MgtC/SapB family protein [Clostridia bacterium]